MVTDCRPGFSIPKTGIEIGIHVRSSWLTDLFQTAGDMPVLTYDHSRTPRVTQGERLRIARHDPPAIAFPQLLANPDRPRALNRNAVEHQTLVPCPAGVSFAFSPPIG
jgi:hypothetical protein